MKRRVINLVIVGDAPVIRAGIRVMLKAQGIRVVGEARNPQEALQLVAARSPDLILAVPRTDDADGLDLVRRIKEKRPKVHVIVLADDESRLYLSRALAVGCSGYLLRDVGRADLLKAVRSIAGGERVVGSTLPQDFLKKVVREPAEMGNPLSQPLAAQEREVLQLISEGRTNRQIARRLGYSMGSVKDYVQRILQKLDVGDRTQAAVKAVRLGLLD